MFWVLLALIGAGTFFVTGFNILIDPLCVSADFGGGRVVQVTCRNDELGSFTGTQAGLISILTGFALLALLFWRPIKLYFQRRKYINSIYLLPNYASNEIQVEKEKRIENEEVNTEDSKKCPKCAEIIKSEALKCRYCGSDLVPTGMEKISINTLAMLRNLFSEKNSYKTWAIILVLLVFLLIYGINTSKAREIAALETNGEVCVFNEDMSINFGCADYPKINFKFCAKHPYYNLYYRNLDFKDVVQNDNYGIFASSFACETLDSPNGFEVNAILREPRGIYEIVGSAYSSPSIDSEIDDSLIYDLFARVSLKE